MRRNKIFIILIFLFSCFFMGSSNGYAKNKKAIEEIKMEFHAFNFDLEQDIAFEKQVVFGEQLEGNLRFTLKRAFNGKELFGLLRFYNPGKKSLTFTIKVMLFDKDKQLIAEDSYTRGQPLEYNSFNATSLNFHLSPKQAKGVKFYSLQYQESLME